ncbi:MAG: hypothetical protein JO314_08465 [Acidobacteria bacterium]|nr:hypothetical protein [Acidobacteriota bacterium]
MAKKQHASSAPDKRRGANVKHITDEEIDFSDIPELTDDQLKRAVRIGRPATGSAKHMIAFRISPNLLSKIRKLADKNNTPYQTYLHQLLEDAVGKKAA